MMKNLLFFASFLFVGVVYSQTNNDSINQIYSFERTVLIEEFSTEKCVYCPPVGLYLKEIEEANERVIMMVHHRGFLSDSYSIPESKEILAFYNASKYAPAGMIDRHYNGLDNDEYEGIDPGPVFWPGEPYGGNRVEERLNVTSMLDVNISGKIDLTNHLIKVKVSGSFLENFNQDIGVSLWITEGGLKSTSQVGWDGEWIHHSVVRDAISETFGDKITTSTAKGDTYKKTYFYAYDSSWLLENIQLVAFVNNMDSTDVNNRNVHNAKALNLLDLVAVGYEQKAYNELLIYPNPAKDNINIEAEGIIDVKLYNIAGQHIKTINGEGRSVINIGLVTFEAGIYYVMVETKKGACSEKIIKQ